MKIIYCECCGKRVMAEMKNDKLVIVNHNHGQNHTVSISISSMLKELLEGLLTKDE